jgi:putative phosphoesterase
MMRLGIISDVHSNMPALSEVLDFLRKEKAGRIIHAGDVVGYNPFPNEVINAFIAASVHSISGNHDRSVISGDIGFFNDVAAEAVLWTRKELKKESLDYISNLRTRERISVDGKTIAVIHGSPFDDDEYIFRDDANEKLLDKAAADILILGHTHVPFIKKLENGLIVNPGSVGQPRDGDWRASCMMLDIPGGDAEIIRLEYPVEETASRIRKANLPEILAERLKSGR